MIQFAAALALGLVTSWLVYQWIGFVGDLYTAFFIGFPLLLAIGFVLDRRAAKIRRASSETPRSER